MIRFLLLCAWLGAYAGPSLTQQASFHFSFDQPSGKYAVGFRVSRQHDQSRRFSATTASDGQPGPPDTDRPLQTLIWYPAKAITAPRMKLKDFEKLIDTETDFNRPAPHGPSQDFVHAFMHGTEEQETLSSQDAPPEGHQFPLLVYAPSLNAPSFENIELCEYLAGYGFIVIASPSMGADSRHMTAGNTDVSAQAADILFLIRAAAAWKDADPGNVAIIGYSLGGSAALQAAAGNPQVHALVALDGSFRYGHSPPVDPKAIAIPLLFFSRGETPLASSALSDPAQKTNARILNDWTHGDSFQARMRAISHIQFSSLYQRSERFQREGMTYVPAGYSLQDGAESYGWIARFTLKFLQAYLKHDRSALTDLTSSSVENAAPSRLLTTSFRAASP